MSTELLTPEATLPIRRVRRPARRGRIILTLRLAVLVAILVAWQVVSTRTDLVPSVQSTIRALSDGIRDHSFTDALWVSSQGIVGGFLIAAVAGILCGLWLGSSRFWGRVLEPILTTFYAIPRIILYPVLLAIFGVGITSERYLAVLSAFFPIAVNSVAGVKSVNPTLTKLGRSVSANRRQLTTRIVLPAAAPAIMVGVRIGWSSAVVTVIAAELVASEGGLGQTLSRSYNLLQYPAMFAVVLLVTGLALCGSVALWWLERRVRAGVE